MKLKIVISTVVMLAAFITNASAAENSFYPTKVTTTSETKPIVVTQSLFIATESCTAILDRRFDNDDYDVIYSCAVNLPAGASIKSIKAYEEGYASLDYTRIDLKGWSVNNVRRSDSLCTIEMQGGDLSASDACAAGNYQAYTLRLESSVRYNRAPAPNVQGSQLNLALESLDCVQAAGEGAETCQISRDAPGKSYVPMIEVKYTM